jgi:hypothetical protein
LRIRRSIRILMFSIESARIGKHGHPVSALVRGRSQK